MALPKALSPFEKLLDKLQYKPTLAGLLRISIWAILFLVLICSSIPKLPLEVLFRENLDEDIVTSMMLSREDRRWVRDDFGRFNNNNQNSLAWVAGSSIILMSESNRSQREFIPQKVTQLLSDKHDITFKTFLYAFGARRPLDTYTMVKDALNRNPDVLVVAVNPFWVFNNKAVFFKPNVFNQGAKVWWNMEDWPWQFTLSSPSNHLYNFLGRQSAIFSDSQNHFNLLNERSKKLVGIELKPRAISGRKASADKKEKKLSQPLQFWLQYQLHDGNIEHKPIENNSHKALAWQAAAISQSDTTATSWALVIMDKILQTIKDSGVPTLLYVAPVSPALSKTYSFESYKEVVETLSSLKDTYNSQNLDIVIDIPQDTKDNIVFRDYLHQSSSGDFPLFLSNRISELIERK